MLTNYYRSKLLVSLGASIQKLPVEVITRDHALLL